MYVYILCVFACVFEGLALNRPEVGLSFAPKTDRGLSVLTNGRPAFMEVYEDLYHKTDRGLSVLRLRH